MAGAVAPCASRQVGRRSTRSRSRGPRCEEGDRDASRRAFLDERRSRSVCSPTIARIWSPTARGAEAAALASGPTRPSSKHRSPPAGWTAESGWSGSPAACAAAADHTRAGRPRRGRAGSASSPAPSALERELAALVAAQRPALLRRTGCGTVTAATSSATPPAPNASPPTRTPLATPAPPRSPPPAPGTQTPPPGPRRGPPARPRAAHHRPHPRPHDPVTGLSRSHRARKDQAAERSAAQTPLARHVFHPPAAPPTPIRTLARKNRNHQTSLDIGATVAGNRQSAALGRIRGPGAVSA